MKQIQWGIIGCGGIAVKFVNSQRVLNNGKVVACASRTPGKAYEFSEKHGIERYFETYESMLADSAVDAVYVATTHNFHYENVKLCLESGKHVLCEKPMTVNAAQAEELCALSEEKGLFLMEAVWSRFLPALRRMQDLLAEGVIGEVTTVHCDFCIRVECDDSHRLKNPDLAGGALLDLGIYPITFAAMVLGSAPEKVTGHAVMGATGVDERSYYFLEYEGGARAVLSSSYTEQSPVDAKIYGTGGYIHVMPPFLGATMFVIHRNGADEPETVEYPCPDMESFQYEIAEAQACIQAGKVESDTLPHAETIAVMKIMDTLRAQWNLVYPGE